MNPCGNNRAVTGGGAGITAGTICCRCAVSDLPGTPREYQADQTYRLPRSSYWSGIGSLPTRAPTPGSATRRVRNSR